MAMFWTRLKNEVQATAEVYREKGAVALLRDAASDTADKAAAARSWVVGPKAAVLRYDGVPELGVVCVLELSDGRRVEAIPLEVDTTCLPHRATVRSPEVEGELVVDIVSLQGVPHVPLLGALTGDLGQAVQAVRGVTLEAAGRVKSTSSSAMGAVRSIVPGGVQGNQSGTEGSNAPANVDFLGELGHNLTDAVKGVRNSLIESNALESAKTATTDFGHNLAESVKGVRDTIRDTGALESAKTATSGLGQNLTESVKGVRNTIAESRALESAKTVTTDLGHNLTESVRGVRDSFRDSSAGQNLSVSVEGVRQSLRESGALDSAVHATLTAAHVVSSTASAAVSTASTFFEGVVAEHAEGNGTTAVSSAQRGDAQSDGDKQDMPLFVGESNVRVTSAEGAAPRSVSSNVTAAPAPAAPRIGAVADARSQEPMVFAMNLDDDDLLD